MLRGILCLCLFVFRLPGGKAGKSLVCADIISFILVKLAYFFHLGVSQHKVQYVEIVSDVINIFTAGNDNKSPSECANAELSAPESCRILRQSYENRFINKRLVSMSSGYHDISLIHICQAAHQLALRKVRSASACINCGTISHFVQSSSKYLPSKLEIPIALALPPRYALSSSL